MVNTVGHTVEIISRLKTLGLCCGSTLFTNPLVLTSEVHVIGYIISIGSKIVSIFKISNLGKEVGTTSVPRIAHYNVALGKSHYTSPHIVCHD